MKEAKIFIVEDEQMLSDQLRIQLEELGYWVVGNADNGDSAIERIISVVPDIVIMDINIKGQLTGIEVARRLATMGYGGGIIFLTSLDDDNIFEEARDVVPFDFLIKPIRTKKLKRTLDLFLANNEPKLGKKKGIVFLKGKNELYKIVIDQIRFIEVQDKMCLISVKDKPDTICIRIGLNEVMNNLDSSSFLKVHRSYVVNERYIDSYDITMNRLVIGSQFIPVSRSCKNELLTRLK